MFERAALRRQFDHIAFGATHHVDLERRTGRRIGEPGDVPARPSQNEFLGALARVEDPERQRKIASDASAQSGAVEGAYNAGSLDSNNMGATMRNSLRVCLTAALCMTAALAMAQNAPALHLEDLLGVWNLTYEGGQTTGTLTISKKNDGTPAIKVSTSQGGESEARDIVIKADTITFARDINVQGQTGSVSYVAKLVAGKLQGTGEVKLGGGGGGPGGGAPTPFSATKAK